MKNKEKLFCESAQRTKSYVTDEQKGFDTVIRQHHNISILSTAILSEERERHGLNQNPVYIGVHDFEASRA